MNQSINLLINEWIINPWVRDGYPVFHIKDTMCIYYLDNNYASPTGTQFSIRRHFRLVPVVPVRVIPFVQNQTLNGCARCSSRIGSLVFCLFVSVCLSLYPLIHYSSSRLGSLTLACLSACLSALYRYCLSAIYRYCLLVIDDGLIRHIHPRMPSSIQIIVLYGVLLLTYYRKLGGPTVL